ncbi:glycosyl hydrolase 53 family protein [Paenibacillus roseipurpureus]|uniref:Arabinogalactan endo-beta-1,4-galactanase n=1 Tax=Paenibacillus roseopurpureus TaxID=2918901 RepID=A0AA96LRL8_9BACL|nr:glycosyl hydrolase 53 family protein [Paenibacillus sp. MBLB1832]WNR45946.1 glycosyl hydrolase 53 family protein [Paenibacillus sp. MBLB1832]
MRKPLKAWLRSVVRSVSLFTLLLTIWHYCPLTAEAAGEDFSSFMKGGTMSHVSEQENAGFVYKENGVAKDPFLTMADSGANYAQFDLFTSSGARGLTDVKALAMRAKNAGLHISINFFYSDDYSNSLPSGWPSDIASLKTKVYEYTTQVLQALDAQGTRPSVVKIGNEIDGRFRDGFLLPVGQKSTNYSNFIALLKQGVAATRDFDPSIKIMIHSAANNTTDNQSFYGGLVANNLDFDIIALSFYQNWQGNLANLNDNLTYLANHFDKKIVIAETAYPWTETNYDTTTNHIPTETGYAHTTQGQYDYLQRMMDIIAKAPGSKGVGMLVWPTDYISTASHKSAWDNSAFWDSLTGNAVSSITLFQTPVKIGSGIAVNLLTNPSFETDGAATQSVTGWSTWSPNAQYSAADYTETGGFLGTYRATHWNANPYEVYTFQIVKNLQNGTYTLKAWVRSGGGQSTAKLLAKNFGSASSLFATIPSSGAWTQITIPNIGVTNGQCEVGVYSVAATGQWLSFDQVELYRQ